MTTTTSDLSPLVDLGPEFFGPSWSSHADARWVEYAWGTLASAGIVPQHPNPEYDNYPDHLVTLAALIYLSDLFADAGREHSAAPRELSGPEPLLTQIQLGRQAERSGVYAEEQPESATGLEVTMVRERTPSVAKALATEVGRSTLFADLWAAHHPKEATTDHLIESDDEDVPHGPTTPSYPLHRDAVDRILNFCTPDKAVTFEWLTSITG